MICLEGDSKRSLEKTLFSHLKLLSSGSRRFNYQMQLNWFHRASDKKAVQELESLVSCEVCY